MKPDITLKKSDVAALEAMMDGLDDKQFPDMDKLLEEIDRANIVEDSDLPADVVCMNSRVTFAGTREFSVTLVFPHQVQGITGNISIASALGSALIGLKEGDSIDWPLTGSKNMHVTIIKVTPA